MCMQNPPTFFKFNQTKAVVSQLIQKFIVDLNSDSDNIIVY